MKKRHFPAGKLHRPPSCSTERNGAALILSLLILTLVTLLVVGFLTVSHLERLSSHSHLERTRASIIAQNGVERVVAQLRVQTDTGRNWTSLPGALAVGDPNAANPEDKVELAALVPLHSGAASLLDLDATNLNAPSLSDPGRHLLTDAGGAPKMRVKWIYMTQDGTPSRVLQYDSSASPPGYVWADNPDYAPDAKTNPVTGRYAYWTDDENAKVNANLAWTRNVPAAAFPDYAYPPGSPSRISLDALSGFTPESATALYRFITVNPKTETASAGKPADYDDINRFFNSPFEARQAAAGDAVLAAALKDHAFSLTHYNHSPDSYLNHWGEPKIVLTCIPERAKRRVQKEDGTWQEIQLPFLDIGATKPSDLNKYKATLNGTVYEYSLDVVNVSKLGATIRLLMSYLTRKDWPMAPGSSFADKYFSHLASVDGGALQEARTMQLALDIIEYVRAKEYEIPPPTPSSPAPVPKPGIDLVDPDRLGIMTALGGYCQGGTLVSGQGGTADFNKYRLRGTTRAPMIIQVGVYVPSASNNPRWTPRNASQAFWALSSKVKTELFLPKHYGIREIPLLGKYGMLVEGSVPATDDNLQAPPLPYVPSLDHMYNYPSTGLKKEGEGFAYGGTVPANQTLLKAGEAVTITFERDIYVAGAPRNVPTAAAAAPYWKDEYWPWGKTMPLTVAIAPVNGSWLQLCGAPVTTDNIQGIVPPSNPDAKAWIQYRLDSRTTPEARISSMEVADPRANGHTLDWVQNARNTFGLAATHANRRLSVGKDPLTLNEPQQDTDKNGKISDASLYMPPPAGRKITYADGFVDDNTLGMVASVAELGYVFTGVTTGKNNYEPGVPANVAWRTLRFQPGKQDATVVPDWALLDIFTVPQRGNLPVPAELILAPHGVYQGGRVNLNSRLEPFGIHRTEPLEALLLGARKDSTNLTSKISAAEAKAIAENIQNRILATDGKSYGNGFYGSTGELAEIKGVTDQGEQSEEIFREILDLAAVRSGVFSVYTVGQALKQLPAGGFAVTGESRRQSMIERYVENGSGDLRFRTVYERQMNP